VAEVVGGDMITRWQKRGAEIVPDNTPLGVPQPKTEPKVEAAKVPDKPSQKTGDEEPVESDEEKVDDKSKPVQADKKSGKQ